MKKRYIDTIATKAGGPHKEEVNRALDEIIDEGAEVINVVTTPPSNDNKLWWNTVVHYTIEVNENE